MARVWTLCCIALAPACVDGGPSPAGSSVAIEVAPLDLPGVTNATWRVTVATASDTVWTRDLGSRAYGDGSGSLSYVGTCDADAGANTVTIELLDLYQGAGGDVVVDAASYDNPGLISRTFTCLPDSDVAVDFDVTVVRAATQGFFDVAVTFDDIFCSAKLDCDNDGPILLLTDSGGVRRPTVVLGFACTADTAANDTVLYLDDLQIDCANSASATVDPSAGPGTLADGSGITQVGADPVLFGAAVYRGDEDLGGVGKLYWNLALGLNLGTAGAQSCTLTTAGTASSGALTGGATPAGETYPYIGWSVPLTSAAGALTCTNHPVGGGNGVAIAYSQPDTPETFAHAWSGAAALPTATILGALTVADPGHWSNGDAAASCDAYRHPVDADHTYSGSTGDGIYRLTAAGVGDYLAYCDMTTADGGWTLVMRSTVDTAYRSDAAAWYTGTATVAAGDALTPTMDGISLAYVNVTGNALMFKTHQEADGYWAAFTLPALESVITLVGVTNINAAPDGYKDTLAYQQSGANALACWAQDWRVRWRNYGSSDGVPDSAVFAPSTLTSSYRPCGGNTAYATGIGVVTDSANGWDGYGGTWEGASTDPAGNSALTGGSVSLWIRGGTVTNGIIGAHTVADPGRWSDGTVAASCYDYRYPSGGSHVYAGWTGDGVYRVNPDGSGDYLVYCDMTLEGGGWTLVMRFTDVNAYFADASVWFTGQPAVASTTAVTPTTTGVSLGYANMAGSELLFKTHGDAVGYWTRFAMPATESVLDLVGTTNIATAADGYKDTLTYVSTGPNALACWGQDWRVRWRNYASGDAYPDSAIFAPSTLTASYRPCGGHPNWATGIGARTDTSNGWTGYGGSWEGVGSETSGNAAVAGSSVSIWVGGP